MVLLRKHPAPSLDQKLLEGRGNVSQTFLCPFLLPDVGLIREGCTGTAYVPGKDTRRKEQRMEAET